jgi:hypothetical protein
MTYDPNKIPLITDDDGRSIKHIVGYTSEDEIELMRIYLAEGKREMQVVKLFHDSGKGIREAYLILQLALGKGFGK